MAIDAKQIKGKIQATKKTAQITKAMNMVSASKLRKIQKNRENYRLFIERIERIVYNLVSTDDAVHPLLCSNGTQSKTCYIIITSERGLAGPYNNNIYKLLAGIIKTDDVILPLGGRGYNYTKNKYQNYHGEVVHLRDDVLFVDIVGGITKVISGYLKKDFDCVKIIYNQFVNTLVQKTIVKQILPVEIDLSKNEKYRAIYDFEGGVEEILDYILPNYIQNIIFEIILDAKASEHASRMSAMKSATDNASEVIKKLDLIYNRARQQAITIELTDIIGGSSATNS